MPRYRALVSTYASTELPKDWCTNTIYFDDGGVGTNAQNLATDIANLFATFRVLPATFNRVKCRLYDMSEPAPREIQAEATVVAATGGEIPGPREVALCLSYHAAVNKPRHRGRMYIGPIPFGQMSQRPLAGLIASLRDTLSTGLENIGGVDVDWCVFSRADSLAAGWSEALGGAPVFRPVKGGWVDDEWDTQRSRGLRLTARNVFTSDE